MICGRIYEKKQCNRDAAEKIGTLAGHCADVLIPAFECMGGTETGWDDHRYFFTFSPDGGGEPTGDLRKAIDSQFGSFDDFKREFVEAGTTLFGSGWVWLSKDDNGKLFITQGRNAENPLRDGLTPILTFDVWEHAYYLDFQNRRADALKALWNIVDWDVVESRY